MGCVSQDSPQKKFCGNLENREQITQASSPRPRCVTKKFGKGSIAGSHAKKCTSGANSVNSNIRGKNARQNPETGATRPQRRIGPGKDVYKLKKEKRYILLSCRILGNAGTFFDKSRRARIRNRLRSVFAQAEQKRSKLRWTGNSSKMQELHNGGDGQWWSANKRGSAAYVHDLHLFVTVQLLEDTPAVLSSG